MLQRTQQKPLAENPGDVTIGEGPKVRRDDDLATRATDPGEPLPSHLAGDDVQLEPGALKMKPDEIGEGNRRAAKRYNDGVKDTLESKDTEALADEAAEALDGPEGESLRQAEQEAKGRGVQIGDVRVNRT